MSVLTVSAARPVLADRLPVGRARDLTLIALAALVTAGMAQLSVPVPGSPVPVTAQSFAVLFCAAAIGPLRGLVGQLLYVSMGVAGLPVFADGGHGPSVLFGATGGYLIGFCVASLLIGAAARAGHDRSTWGMALAFVAASAVIYVPGVLWLAQWMHADLGTAMAAGCYPYLIGDLIKAAVAAVIVPGAWRLLR